MNWISVNEKLPEIEGLWNTSVEVLVSGYSKKTDDVVVSIGWIDENGDWCLVMENEGNDVEVSHWMNMPTPPKEKGK